MGHILATGKSAVLTGTHNPKVQYSQVGDVSSYIEIDIFTEHDFNDITQSPSTPP